MSGQQARKVLRSAGDETVKVTVGGLTIGDGAFTVIAGPCALENAEQLIYIPRPDGMGIEPEPRRVKAYPFQVLGPA